MTHQGFSLGGPENFGGVRVERLRAGAVSKEEFPEIAFLGRSNVGKSSLINALIGQRVSFHQQQTRLHASDKFLSSRRACCFVDLPGYGYARVSKDQTLQWKKLIESYLLERKALELSLLILDSRRGWMERDLDLKRWLEVHCKPYLVVATKMDKLNQSERQKSLASLSRDAGVPVLSCSATTGRGMREIWQAITTTRRS